MSKSIEKEAIVAVSNALANKSIKLTIIYTVPLEYANIGELLDNLRENGSAEVVEFELLKK